MHTGCLICSKELVYGVLKERTCELCGKKVLSEVACSEGHYVCDACHSQDAIAFLEKFIEHTTLTDPVAMAVLLMQHPSFKMHGTEHHFIVPAVVLKSLQNAGYTVHPRFLKMVQARCDLLPGGTCGYWGACAAGIGAGITASIYYGADPLKKDEYKLVHHFTTDVLAVIASIGGPRCCKRNVFSSILSTVHSLKKYAGVTLSVTSPKCTFYHANQECLKNSCPYYGEK